MCSRPVGTLLLSAAAGLLAVTPGNLPGQSSSPSAATPARRAKSGPARPRAAVPAHRSAENQPKSRQASWSDVLGSLAKETGKTLIATRLPNDTISLRAEAHVGIPDLIGMLNRMLLIRGLVLIIDEDAIIVTDLDAAMLLAESVPLEELGKRDQSELVRVLVPVKGVNAMTLRDELNAVLGPAGSIAALPSLNQLAITSTVENVRFLVELLDRAPETGNSPRLSGSFA